LLAFARRLPFREAARRHRLASPQTNAMPARIAILPFEDPPATVIRCLGTFSITIQGRAIDPATLRPRIGRLLRLLAFNAGHPVHREVLTEALWPGTDPAAAARNLHVAVSTLRRVLETDLPRGSAGSLVAREGDSYRLCLPEDAFVDIRELDAGLDATRAALDRSDVSEALREFRRALALYVADILPDEGPSEWIVGERERRRLEITELARDLADALIHAGWPTEASWVCRRGILVDRYHDPLWRSLVRACELAGDLAASARARLDYQALLLELGILPSVGPADQDALGTVGAS
jgi:DNA-binding SARP family transcriptional activator